MSQISTWKKILELSSSNNESDYAYAQIIATVVDFRMKLGITQVELAEKSGLSVSMISKIESLKNVPTIKTFLKYILALGVNWEFVCDEKRDRF